MMTGFLWDALGGGLALSEFITWKFTYTGGVPCDGFYVECPWSGEHFLGLTQGVAFTASWKDDVVFRGVLDEFELILDGKGRRLCLSGRGMAARLLDNEALGMEYQSVTLADILRDHVTPYGVEVSSTGSFPTVSGFSVGVGSSAWHVVYQYGRYCGGVSPRFHRDGRLILAPFLDDTFLSVDGATPLMGLTYRVRRYGVLSHVLVRDKTRLAVETVENPPFLALGGMCRRVVTMPGASTYQAMRYTGEFQLEQSMADWYALEFELPYPFACFPGDLVVVEREACDFNGRYRVIETVVEQDTTWVALRRLDV